MLVDAEVVLANNELEENNGLCKKLEEGVSPMKKSTKEAIEDDNEATLKGPIE